MNALDPADPSPKSVPHRMSKETQKVGFRKQAHHGPSRHTDPADCGYVSSNPHDEQGDGREKSVGLHHESQEPPKYGEELPQAGKNVASRISTDSASNSGQESPPSHRRFWRWGTWVWLVAWIVLMLVIVELSANLKGIAGIQMVVGTGSVGIGMNLDGDHSPNSFRVSRPQFIWSHLDTFANNPEYLFGILGHAGWHDFGGSMLTLPIAGFLWLWLIGAWTDGFKKLRCPESFGSKRTMVRIATLVLLPLLILFTDHKWRVAKQTTGCILQVRNIQQAVRGQQGMTALREGEPMPWDEIFGTRKFLPSAYRKCACGQPYRLTPHVPRMGEVAAQCPDPGHQRRMEQIDTSGW